MNMKSSLFTRAIVMALPGPSMQKTDEALRLGIE
jgi:hypothetical protein